MYCFNIVILFRGPKVAEPGQNQPTTGNIQIFRGELKLRDNIQQQMLLLDVEGDKGGTPKMLHGTVQAFFSEIMQRLSGAGVIMAKLTSVLSIGGSGSSSEQQPENTTVTPEDIDKLLERRMHAVREIFPQIVYALADVVVYIARDPPHNKVRLQL